MADFGKMQRFGDAILEYARAGRVIRQAEAEAERAAQRLRNEFGYEVDSPSDAPESPLRRPVLTATRGVMSGDLCVGGTRIPVSGIKGLRRNRGLDAVDIANLYPDLTIGEVQWALDYDEPTDKSSDDFRYARFGDGYVTEDVAHCPACYDQKETLGTGEARCAFHKAGEE